MAAAIRRGLRASSPTWPGAAFDAVILDVVLPDMDGFATCRRFRDELAGLRALVGRGPVERPAVLQAGDLRLDPAGRQVWRGDIEINLSAREFAVLETFMRRPGHVSSQLQLLEAA